jgi:hypothetical protein
MEYIYGCALRYVKNQTEQICVEAIKQNDIVLAFVKKKRKEFVKKLLDKIGLMNTFNKRSTIQTTLSGRKMTLLGDLSQISFYTCYNMYSSSHLL